MSGKITRESLTILLAQKMGIKIWKARQFVDLTLARMGDGIIHDEKLMLSGFGTFQVHSKGARPGRNPKTGKPAMITPRRIVTFKASKRVTLQIVDDKTKTKG